MRRDTTIHEDHPPKLLFPIDAARWQLGGISRPTLYRLIARGDLVKVNIGVRGFVTADSITAYLDRLTAEAKAPA